MEKILKTKTAYKGKVVSLEEVDIDFGNTKRAVFELVKFNVLTGVSAFPLKGKNVILIKHFQLGAKKRMLTLPTGGLEKGENPEKRMQQELQEEIGYKAGKLTLMLRAHAIPGYIGTQPAYIYLAEDLSPSKIPGDEHEDIEVVTIPFSKLLKLIQKGKILDSRIILAALYYHQFLK